MSRFLPEGRGKTTQAYRHDCNRDPENPFRKKGGFPAVILHFTILIKRKKIVIVQEILPIGQAHKKYG